MSSSTDSLKKKVCVTVFLDELFEEVQEEERREPKQVSELAESVAKVPEKPYKEPSRVDLDNDEGINVSPNADTKQNQVQGRPRKHRRESKFSKNRYDSFKNELSKYGYGSRTKVANESREPVDSNLSDSDFDLDEFLGLDKWTFDKSGSSVTELSECDLTEESFLSINPVLSSAVIPPCPKETEICREKSNCCNESPVLHCNKSTQFEAASPEADSSEGCLPDEAALGKGPQTAREDISTWKKTQREIQCILAEVKSRCREETCEGDSNRQYDLKCLLEDCVRTEGGLPDRNVSTQCEGVRSSASTDDNELEMQGPSDSYTCVLPHKQGSFQKPPPEVKRVWTSTRRSIWNDGFESDLSEADCGHQAKDIGLRPLHNDSLLCFTLCLKCQEGDSSEKEERKYEGSAEKVPRPRSLSTGRTSCRKASMESMRPRCSRDASLVFQAVAHLADRTIETVLKVEQEKNEGDLSAGASKGPPMMEGRSKNFAEGDTIAKPSNNDSQFILEINTDTKEKLFVCGEILKHVGETKVIRNEIIVNRAEIELRSKEEAQEEADIVKRSPQTATASEVLAEVFFNQKQTESLEKNVTDAESEMVFAESENYGDSEDFFCSRLSIGPAPSLSFQGNHLQKDICVLEFEDKLSRSKILRRMKTVEILGDNSLNDMKNISTEVILICENLSNKEVCLEAWQGSASARRSISEMKQCYLKDSEDNAMYLIEIPLHFTYAPKERNISHSNHFFKPSDSD